MKTRIIQTSFWKDSKVNQMSLYAQHLFIYLITCEHIGLTGIFELPDQYIKLQTKLTDKQLKDSKLELESLNRVFFYDGWIKVNNAERHNNYMNSPKNEVAYNRELMAIPSNIVETFNSSIDSTMYSNHKSETINHKSETIISDKVKFVSETLGPRFKITPKVIEIVDVDFGKYKIRESVKDMAIKYQEEYQKNPTTGNLKTWLRNDLNWGKLERIEE